jgi:hypothetical protein
VTTRRGILSKWQRSPAFKKMKREHALAPGAECAHCHRHHGDVRHDRDGFLKVYEKGKKKGQPILTHLTINHMSETSYLTEDLYCTWDPALMEVCCLPCNGWDRKGLEVCPVCRCNPIKKDDPVKMCVACYLDAHPEIRKQREESAANREESNRLYNRDLAEKRRKTKVKHPCFWRTCLGKCRASQVGARCEFAPTKAAANCKVGFKAKKK